MTPDGRVSSLMGPFIECRGDWKIVEMSGLVKKLREVNGGRRPAHALYLYEDPAYCTVYGIMGPYKNYPGRPRTPAQEKFNKAISKLRIEVEHGFAIYQNLWTWNGFHLGLKICQRAAIGYAVSILLSNIWTCMRGNQTSYRFACAPPAVEEYFVLIPTNADEDNSSEDETTDADAMDEGDESADKNEREKPEQNEVKADE